MERTTQKISGRTRLLRFVMAVAFLGGGIFVCIISYKFLEHERMQNSNIQDLQAQMALIRERMSEDTASAGFADKVTEDGYDYLAIGNSITLHGIADYWWSECGMAASQPELDYYHRVVAGLEEQNGRINAAAYNYYVWEAQGHDRAETYDMVEKYLVSGIDLVTVQLSENCFDLSTFETDLKELLNYIKEKAGESCQIIVIDDFWSEEKHQWKKAVCEELDLDFVDLSDLRGKDSYKAGMGAMVSGDDGLDHVIEHEGVAGHPGDEGMRVIAERVLEKVFRK